MVPSVNVIIENAAGDILLIERSDNGNWALPGGAIDLGESMSQAGVRETKEETGIDCEILDVLGIYTDPKHIILYTSNGEARQVQPFTRPASVSISSSSSHRLMWFRAKGKPMRNQYTPGATCMAAPDAGKASPNG